MSTRRNRKTTPLALAALAASLPLSLALAAGYPMPHMDRQPGVQSGGALVEEASLLMERGRLVEAHARLIGALRQQGEAALSEADSARARTLLVTVTQRMLRANALDISIQKAELALKEGDVRLAERHAAAVRSGATASATQAARAQELLDAAGRRKGELARVVPDMIAQAERDFLAGRYAEAKAGLGMVGRSGVELAPEQRALVERYRLRLVELETAQGRPFDLEAALGVMQPGVVRRREQPPEQPPEPPDEPAQEPPSQFIPDDPAAQPEEPPPPPPQELIEQARRFEAQSILAEADRAFEARRLAEAQNRYNVVLTEYRGLLTPEQVARAEERLRETRLILQGQPGGQLEGELRQEQIARQEAVATFTNQMGQARRALETGDTQRARQLAASADLTIRSARGLFSEAEFEGYRTQINTFLAQVATTETRVLTTEAERRDREMAAAAAERQREQERERAARINELLDRARAYQRELRYQEALQSIDQLLFLDPINPAGLFLRDVLYDIVIYRDYNKLQDRKLQSYVEQSIENQEAGIAPRGPVDYPTDWPQISVRRGEPVAFADTPENRRVLAELEGRRIPSVQFADNTFGDVVQFVEAITQLNIDVDWASLDQIGITPDSTVSLNLTNVTPRTMLDRVVEKVGGAGRLEQVDWAVIDGIVQIASDDRIRRHTATVVYDMRDLLIEVPDYTEVPRIDLQSVLQSQQGGGGQSPFTEQEDQNQEEQRRALEDRLDDLIDIITQNIDFEGWVENGGNTGRIQKLVMQGGSLIITNTPRNHRAIGGLLDKLREIRAMQINAETRFLLVNQDWFEQIGFDIDVVLNSDNNQVRAARAADPSVQGGDFFAFNPGQLPTGQSQIGLRRDIIGSQRRTVPPGIAPTPGALDGDTGTTPFQQGIINPRPWSPIGMGQNSLGLSQDIVPASDWASTILGAAPALGIAGQFLDDVQVDFLIRATQANRRSIQLTAPRLTFTNGQTANIYVVTQQAFISDLQPVVGESAVGFDPTVASISEGVTMLLEGTVSADRRYVTLNVDTGVSRIDGFAQQAVTAVAGGQLVDSSQTQSFIQLPTVTVTRVRTTVTVPDQGTVLLGGQRLVTEFEVETGVPVLSKLPIINRFFTNRIESKEEQTLLILIKPTVLIQNEEEDRNFPGLADRLRPGFGG